MFEGYNTRYKSCMPCLQINSQISPQITLQTRDFKIYNGNPHGTQLTVQLKVLQHVAKLVDLAKHVQYK